MGLPGQMTRPRYSTAPRASFSLLVPACARGTPACPRARLRVIRHVQRRDCCAPVHVAVLGRNRRPAGEARDAAANLASLHRKLQRALQGSRLPWATWAQLEAAVLAREAELVLSQAHTSPGERATERAQAVALLTSALHVCLNARFLPRNRAPA